MLCNLTSPLQAVISMVILLIHDSCARRHSSRAYRNHRRIRRQPKTPFTCQHFRIHRKVGQQALGDCSGPVDPMISVNSRQNEAPTYGPSCTGQEDQEATPSLGIKPASVSAQSVDRHSINNVGAVITDSERDAADQYSVFGSLRSRSPSSYASPHCLAS